jgi:dolichol-phosphate mannosyltransferase
VQNPALAEVQLSIVIPAWNERSNLEILLPELHEAVRQLDVSAEIVIVDGGSVDGTEESAARLGATVVRQMERGYGGALIAGFENSRAPYIVTMDADLSHPPRFVEELWSRRQQADVLIASRYVPEGSADMRRSRRLLSRVLNGAFRWMLALPFHDMSSGFRMYRRDVVAGLRPEARDFDVLQEILMRAYLNGARIQEVPFHYRPRGAGRSHARLIQFGRSYLRTLLRMRKLSAESAARR